MVKSYPDTQEGRASFAAEAAGLALTSQSGRPLASDPAGPPLAWGPSLLAVSKRARVIVMTDLGIGSSLADLLLGEHAEAAEATLLSWARACGELALACAGREAELARLLAGYRTGQDGAAGGHWLPRRIRDVPGLLAELSIPAPPGLDADLAEIASILEPGSYHVFSPGDICPDNNLLTPSGVRFIDYENAEYHPAFLDAAYLRMPFSTCWCVFRLPYRLQRSAEAVYRDLVAQVHPDLASDEVWLPGVRRAVAAWTLHAMTYLLDRSLLTDRPMIDDGRAAPTGRQLLRYRWTRLIAELEPAGELTALRALASQLLERTAQWQLPELPLYPAFR